MKGKHRFIDRFIGTDAFEEMEKCKNNPYYFCTNYILIDGKKFTTPLSEKEFNETFKKLKNGTTHLFYAGCRLLRG